MDDPLQLLKIYEKKVAGKTDWKHAHEIIESNRVLFSMYESGFFALLEGRKDADIVKSCSNRVHPTRYEGIIDRYRDWVVLRCELAAANKAIVALSGALDDMLKAERSSNKGCEIIRSALKTHAPAIKRARGDDEPYRR